MKAVNGVSHSRKAANIVRLDLVRLTSSWNERGPTRRQYKAIFHEILSQNIQFVTSVIYSSLVLGVSVSEVVCS